MNLGGFFGRNLTKNYLNMEGIQQKVPPEKFRQKKILQKILQKNSQKISKQIQRNSKKFPPKIITNIALRGRNPFRACFLLIRHNYVFALTSNTLNHWDKY